MSQQSIGRRISTLARTIARPVTQVLGYAMKATGRAYNQTYYSGSGGDLPSAGRAPRKRARQGRRHGARR